MPSSILHDKPQLGGSSCSLLSSSSQLHSVIWSHIFPPDQRSKVFQIQQIPGLEKYETSWPAIIVDDLEVSGELWPPWNRSEMLNICWFLHVSWCLFTKSIYNITYRHNMYILVNIIYAFMFYITFGPVLTSRHLLEEPWSFLGTVLILLSKPERLCWVTGSKDTFREASLGFLGHIIESIGHRMHVAYKDFRSYADLRVFCTDILFTPKAWNGLCVLERRASLNMWQHAILNGFDP